MTSKRLKIDDGPYYYFTVPQNWPFPEGCTSNMRGQFKWLFLFLLDYNHIEQHKTLSFKDLKILLVL